MEAIPHAGGGNSFFSVTRTPVRGVGKPPAARAEQSKSQQDGLTGAQERPGVRDRGGDRREYRNVLQDSGEAIRTAEQDRDQRQG